MASKEHYTVSSLEALPGEGELSALELSYLHAAGINPNLLNEIDRAEVIRLLVLHPDRIENPRIGDVAALLYRFGLLEEMLDGDDEGVQALEERKKEEEKRKDHIDQLLYDEVQRMRETQPNEYYTQYSVPLADYATAEAQTSPQIEQAFWATSLDFPQIAASVGALDAMIIGINPAKLGIALDDDPNASPAKPDKTPEIEKPVATETESSSSAPKPATGGWVAAVTEADPTVDPLEK